MKVWGFTALAVALDSADAARPWIEAAAPSYPCLVDRDHHLAALYGMVNVPEAVWIDEAGRIVRFPENAGSYDGFRRRDRTTGVMPAAEAERVARAKSTYMAAVRDWAINGSASQHVAVSDDAGGNRLRSTEENGALGHAHFRLGSFLLRNGRPDDAGSHFVEACRLHPDSWTIWRQHAARNEHGFAAGPEFWARVDALGERRYYEQVAIDGMP